MKKLIPTIYDDELKLGGSTKPWTVFAIDLNDINKPEALYVVKLFTPNNVSQQPCIAKEFICHTAAKEFELFVPECGIIDLNNLDFFNTLEKAEKKILTEKHKGYTFASEFLKGPLVVEGSFSEIEEMAMVYAFDCFIMNVDRFGFHKKPNLILHKNRLMLIDHELSLAFIDNGNSLDAILSNLNKGNLLYPYKTHLFYHSLRRLAKENKHLFDTFQMYLMNFNSNNIRTVVNELIENNVSVGNISFLYEYINEIKARSSRFCELLRATLK